MFDFEAPRCIPGTLALVYTEKTKDGMNGLLGDSAFPRKVRFPLLVER